MGSFYASTHVKAITQQSVKDALNKLSFVPAYVAREEGSWISIYPAQSEHQTKNACKALSKELKAVVFSMRVFDSDVLEYDLFANGKKVDAYDSRPEYGTSRERGPVGGSVEALKQYCMKTTTVQDLERVLHGAPDSPWDADMRATELGKLLGIDGNRIRLDFHDFKAAKKLTDVEAEFVTDQAALPDESRLPVLWELEEYKRTLFSKEALENYAEYLEAMSCSNPDYEVHFFVVGQTGFMYQDYEERSLFFRVFNSGGHCKGLRLTLSGTAITEELIRIVGAGIQDEDSKHNPSLFSTQQYDLKFEKLPDGLRRVEIPEMKFQHECLLELTMHGSKAGRGELNLHCEPMSEYERSVKQAFSIDVAD